LCISDICAHYDGIIWPELQSATEDGSSDGVFMKAWKWVTGNKPKESTPMSTTAAVSTFEQNFINIKHLQPNDHIRYRLKALRMYLKVLKDKLNAQETKNDPIHFIRMIYAIYDSLISRSLFYDDHEQEWRIAEAAQVHCKKYISSV